MRITINPAICDGFGYCAEMLPEVLSLDEWGFPIIGEGEIPEQLWAPPSRRCSSVRGRALRLQAT